MKNLFFITLAGVLFLALNACNKDKKVNPNTTDPATNYFYQVKGMKTWSGSAGFVHPDTNSVAPVTDTQLAIDVNPDVVDVLSVKVGDAAFPQDRLKSVIDSEKVSYSSYGTNQWNESVTYSLQYYFANDSISYEYVNVISPGGRYILNLHTRK